MSGVDSDYSKLFPELNANQIKQLHRIEADREREVARLTTIEILERVSCCDHAAIRDFGDSLNVCHGDHLDLLDELRKQ